MDRTKIQQIQKKSYGAKLLIDEHVVDEFKSPLSEISRVENTHFIDENEGFIELWTIKNKQLCLVELIGKHQYSGLLPIVADWFSETLVIPLTDEVYEVGIYVGSFCKPTIYTKALFLEFENGELISTRVEINDLSEEEKHKREELKQHHLLQGLEKFDET